MGSISRTSVKQVAEWVRTGQVPEPVSLIDVRDEDHRGGHVRGSWHLPSDEVFERMEELVRKTVYGSQERSVDGTRRTVVFYCMHSRMRGPSAAQLYAQCLRRYAVTLNDDERAAYRPPAVYVMDGGYRAFAKAYARTEPDLFEDLKTSGGE